MAQQKADTPTITRSQRQPSRRGEIGGRTVLRQFGDDGGEHMRLERFLHRPERINRPRNAQQQQALHGEPKRSQAGAIKRTRLGAGEIRLDP